MLSERSQTQNVTFCVILFIRISRKGIATNNRKGIIRSGARGEERSSRAEVLEKTYKGEGTVLYLDRSNGYTMGYNYQNS